MVGDWVRHINGTPYQVTCIKHNDFACGIPHLWSYNNKFEPIPLTKEILEKNGFEEDITRKQNPLLIYTKQRFFRFPKGTGFNIEEYEETIDENEHYFTLTGHSLIRVYYVHEFQHILRLCGINKDIVL